jgi:hypothetical protein
VINVINKFILNIGVIQINWTRTQIAKEILATEKKTKEDNKKWRDAMSELKIEVLNNEDHKN